MKTSAGARREPSAISHQPSALKARIARALRVVRTIIGAPDYDRYVAHMQSHHPECSVMSRDEFMQQRLESKYLKPGSRCC